MTTIACNGREMAGDGQISGNGLSHMTACPKVFRLNDGRVVGFSGSPFFHREALAYLNGETDSLDLDGEFEAVILHADGRCECMDSRGRRYEQSTPCVSGSGGAVALGAMAAGKSPSQAVAIAAVYDQATGGTITSLAPEPCVKAVA